MNLGDLILNLVLILAVSYFVNIGWYPQAIGVFMFFILVQFNTLIVWITRPLPRWIYAIQQMPTQEQAPPEAVPLEK